jgi:hypothetical protein
MEASTEDARATEPSVVDVFRERRSSRELSLSRTCHDRSKTAVFGNLHVPYFPIFQWVKSYKISEYLFWDINAGIVVGVLLIPQGMAYALVRDPTALCGALPLDLCR